MEMRVITRRDEYEPAVFWSMIIDEKKKKHTQQNQDDNCLDQNSLVSGVKYNNQ